MPIQKIYILHFFNSHEKSCILSAWTTILSERGHTIIIGTRHVLSENIIEWVSVAAILRPDRLDLQYDRGEVLTIIWLRWKN